MVVVTWNIQNGKGCDGVIDLARISKVIHSTHPDVACLQEIARHDPAYDGGADQVAQLAALFPGYEAVFGKALDRQGRQYGNLVLSRLPVLQSFSHLLPHPAAAGIKRMQRVAVEVVVDAPGGPLRVITTHLEYYSANHRAAQIARLRELQDEVAGSAASPPKPGASPYDLVPRPASLVLCGDFNVLPHEPEYAVLFSPPLIDAWRLFHKGKADPATTGVHDRVQWPMGGHCRDYFALTADLARRIASVEVDLATDASDHQPLRLALR